MAQNVSIAFGTVIEAATGGSGADWITGNAVAKPCVAVPGTTACVDWRGRIC